MIERELAGTTELTCRPASLATSSDWPAATDTPTISWTRTLSPQLSEAVRTLPGMIATVIRHAPPETSVNRCSPATYGSHSGRQSPAPPPRIRVRRAVRSQRPKTSVSGSGHAVPTWICVHLDRFRSLHKNVPAIGVPLWTVGSDVSTSDRHVMSTGPLDVIQL